MTEDLVKRLRDRDAYAKSNGWDNVVFGQAAEQIEILEEALRKIETLELDPRNSGQMWVEALKQIARAALKGNRDD